MTQTGRNSPLKYQELPDPPPSCKVGLGHIACRSRCQIHSEGVKGGSWPSFAALRLPQGQDLFMFDEEDWSRRERDPEAEVGTPPAAVAAGVLAARRYAPAPHPGHNETLCCCSC